MAKFEKGNPGGPGRPKMTQEEKDIRKMALEHAEAAVAALVANLKAENASVAAAREILDRAFGKPVQRNEQTGPNGGPIQMDINVNFVGKPEDQGQG